MALPVLDGNQSATTLSSVVTGGEHIVAHSVVSLGQNAISDITTAVSGSVVSISNFPSSTTVTGQVELGPTSLNALESITVTMGQVTVTGGLTDAQLRASAVTAAISNFPATQTIAGTVTPLAGQYTTITSGSVAVGSDSSLIDVSAYPNGAILSVEISPTGGANGVYKIQRTTSIGVGSTDISVTNIITGSSGINISASGTFTFRKNFGVGEGANFLRVVYVSGVGGTAHYAIRTFSESYWNQTVPISGTVTANVDTLFGSTEVYLTDYDTDIKFSSANPFPISGTVTIGNSVTIGSLPAITGTVTVGNTVTVAGTVTANPTGTQTIAGSVTIGAGTAQIGSVTASISSFATSVTARLINPAGTAVTYAEVGTAGSPSIDVLSVQGVSGGTAVPISISSVTIGNSVTIGAVPNGVLTTRFGSVTTANTAQISSAVTLATRKYLLIQNVTTSSNVITVGVGFTPTTTQGIQLAAGAGITFESSYIPTGAVYILSSVTASPFTILEA